MNLSMMKDRELTHIDILDDSVVDIMDKIFYKATSGKTIDYAGDTPMPNAVNPLTDSQVLEWGDSAMKISFQRVSRTPIRFGKRVISKSPRFSQRSTAEPFYGYKSDAPAAKAFKSDEPIGPAAKALKAAGVLSAVAEHSGCKTDAYFKLFESVWTPINQDVAKYVTPDVSAASSKDLIKFIRSTDHVSYGFNHDAPAVTIDTGKYKPETMAQNYMYDWHSFALTLRFMGEFMYKYNVNARLIDTTFYAAPAYAEGRKYEMYDMSFSAKVDDFPYKSAIIGEISDTTMRYYTACVNDYGVSNRLRAHAANISVSADSDATAAMLRKIESKRSFVKIVIPKNAAVYMDPIVYGDITSNPKPRFRDTIDKLVSLNKHRYIPTWKSVHATVWAWAFRSGFKKCAELTSYLRQARLLSAYDSQLRAGYLAAVASTIPKGIGHMIKVMLTSMMASNDDANAEFAEMLIDLAGTDKIDFNMSYDSMYVTAIRTTLNAQNAMKKIQMGKDRAADYAHSANSLISEVTLHTDLPSAVTAGFREFMLRRLDYWSLHYRSRMFDYQALLHNLRNIAKERGFVLTGINSLGKTLSLDHIVPYPIEDAYNVPYEEFLQLVGEYKKKAVMYNFLATGYKHATVVFESTMSVKVFLKSGDLRRIMHKTSTNFARKKEKWKVSDADNARLWPVKVQELQRLDRNVDILRLCDSFLNPPHKWLDMYTELASRFRVTSKLVNGMVRKHVMGKEATLIDPELDEAHEVREAIVLANGEKCMVHTGYISGTNRYAALADDDDDDDGLFYVPTDVLAPTPNLANSKLNDEVQIANLTSDRKDDLKIAYVPKPAVTYDITATAKNVESEGPISEKVLEERLRVATEALEQFRLSKRAEKSDVGHIDLTVADKPIIAVEPKVSESATPRIVSAFRSNVESVSTPATFSVDDLVKRYGSEPKLENRTFTASMSNVAVPKNVFDRNVQRVKLLVKDSVVTTYNEEAFEAFVKGSFALLNDKPIYTRQHDEVVGEYHKFYADYIRSRVTTVPVDENKVDIV